MGDTVANSDPIHWTQARRRLDELTPWPRNPRQIKLPQAKRLLESVQEFGQVETLAVGPDGDIYNGHQRLNVLMEKYGPDYEVDVRVSSRPLSEKEREKLTVYLHKGAAGEWDFDTLANEFDMPDLVEWGFAPYELGLVGGGVDYDDEWKGMPEFEQEYASSIHCVKVHFMTEGDIADFARLMGQTVNNKTKAIWYPKVDDLNLKLYVAHES